MQGEVALRISSFLGQDQGTVFKGLVSEAIHSFHALGEDIKILECWTRFVSVEHNGFESCQGVFSGLIYSRLLRNHLSQVSGIADNCVERQRSESSSPLCPLSHHYMDVRHGN